MCWGEFLCNCIWQNVERTGVRVLGKELELAIMAYLVNEARPLGVKRILGRFVPTVKNDPAKDFYPRAGFSEVSQGLEGETDYLLTLTEKDYTGPEFIKIEVIGVKSNHAE